eukprot:TRINITY_DN3206_c0_g2_i1.p2 TRINITY_DN3206_c0_g2~~TRINITY_DN3206_c0_g2_i1.p2  ORF type:complete len:112 (+),score=25.04 TRINITY_DN3206_c0_g2_i1:26-361(+)
MGFEKEILAAGTGPNPQVGQTVTVHCTGYVKGETNKKFWSTKDPGQKVFSFQIGKGKVIKGWDQGVLTMQVGESARLTLTPDFGYGVNGFPSWGIPGNAVLIFEIELLSVK